VAARPMWQTDAQRSRYRIRCEGRRSGRRYRPAAHLGELIGFFGFPGGGKAR
jgi:hypothetical protein